MRKRTGTVCIVLGVICVAAAVGLYLYNAMEDRQAGKVTEELLPEVQSAMEQRVPDEPETVLIDGREYIGYLSIPALNLELPVQGEWSYPNLKISPCRYTGSPADGDLVIAAHNYKKHFGQISTLQPGTAVEFTNAAGRVFRYTVDRVETLEATALEEMTAGDWDLTLFTCTYGGQSRVTVRCSAAEETAPSSTTT